MKQIIECVPNFSEGIDKNIIDQIANAIAAVDGVHLLDVDPGKATNRTVVTFVGDKKSVVEGAYAGFVKAAELIDMAKHQGEHPRMGAVDVCPFIPVANASMQDCIDCAHALAKRVGESLNIPCYLYESAAQKEDRKNLAVVRAGEYEGWADKINDANWVPDYGPKKFNVQSGCSVIGARDFLVAYNINLNTTSTRRANSVAFDLRENGRVIEENSKKILDEHGEPKREPGLLKSVKAIGWYIEEYGIAQISMNLTNINDTPLHIAFDKACERATARGLRVTGSELVGLLPLQCILDAGRYFLEKQNRSTGVGDAELIRIAIKSLGLNELGEFDPQKKIIEYVLGNTGGKLVNMKLTSFATETASESPAPGGGSISAYVGALGAALGTMVANLSSHKKGWDDRCAEFSTHAENGQALMKELLALVDEDTNAFNTIMTAFSLPKNTDEEKAARSEAIQDATAYATKVPLRTMKAAAAVMPLCKTMATEGNPNSVSDAGVGALCARSAVYGAYLNVQINASGLKDKAKADAYLLEAKSILDTTIAAETEVLQIVDKVILAQ
jgi:glutamate formiminotransferase / formiminotetrahydrofolate cyclodeaminase